MMTESAPMREIPRCERHRSGGLEYGYWADRSDVRDVDQRRCGSGRYRRGVLRHARRIPVHDRRWQRASARSHLQNVVGQSQWRVGCRWRAGRHGTRLEARVWAIRAGVVGYSTGRGTVEAWRGRGVCNTGENGRSFRRESYTQNGRRRTAKTSVRNVVKRNAALAQTASA